MSDLGRQVKYGIGKETTPGTAVASTYWVNQLDFDLANQVDYATNNSAFGVLEKVNDSTVTHQWAEGKLSAKLDASYSGLILLGAFGSVSTATNADASGNVKDHTFTINQSVNGQTLTFVRKDSLGAKAYALGRIGKFELTMKLDDYITFSAEVMAKVGAATTGSPAIAAPTEFVAKHFTLKTASTVAGLSGATAISALESFTLTVDPNIDADFQAGSGDPYAFSSKGYDLEFELETRYNDTTLEDAYVAGTPLAMSVSAVNTDVTIGTSARPGLVFTAPKIKITDWSRSEDLSKPITQKVKGTIHFSAPDAYALKAVFTSLVPSF